MFNRDYWEIITREITLEELKLSLLHDYATTIMQVKIFKLVKKYDFLIIHDYSEQSIYRYFYCIYYIYI